MIMISRTRIAGGCDAACMLAFRVFGALCVRCARGVHITYMLHTCFVLHATCSCMLMCLKRARAYIYILIYYNIDIFFDVYDVCSFKITREAPRTADRSRKSVAPVSQRQSAMISNDTDGIEPASRPSQEPDRDFVLVSWLCC
jgi:hypothetical protein